MKILNSNNQPFVIIVIINWNGINDTIECINSLLKIKYENYRILLIDNGSINNEANKLRKLYGENSKIKIVVSKKNLGFAGGVNVGIKESIVESAQYTLLLNNDTIVSNNFLSELVNVAESNEGTGIVSSAVYFYNKKNVKWSSGYNVNYLFPPFSKKYNQDNIAEVDEVLGCCMLIKNIVFKDIGLFNEKYFAYSEESDFNYRLKKKGYRIFVNPKSKIWHKVSMSTGGGFNRIVAYYKMRNKVLFAKFNYPLYYWPSYTLYLLLYFLYHQFKALRSKKYDINYYLSMGFYDGIFKTL